MMKIDRIWAMPNRWTFTIKPIAELLLEEGSDFGWWIDPFAGYNSPAHIKNDLDKNAPTESHKDALEFLSEYEDSYFMGALYDPPYSFRQASECYKSNGKDKLTATVTSKKYWKDVKDEIARIVCPGGKVISFGWNTNGMGKGRGFELQRVLIVPHGGSMNDTLVTVEIKIAEKEITSP